MKARTLVPIATLLFSLAPILSPPVVEAHPLGSFTVNRYTRLEFHPDRAEVLYLLDLAEVPAFTEIRAMDLDRDGSVSTEEARSYAGGKAEAVRPHLELTLGGHAVPLTLREATALLEPGQAGLSTVRFEARFTAVLPCGAASALCGAAGRGPVLEGSFRDVYQAERTGWREIVVQGLSGVEVLATTGAPADMSEGLRSYPTDLLASPLDQREALFTLGSGAGGSVRVGAHSLGGRALQAVAAPMEPVSAILAGAGEGALPLLLSLLAAAGLGAAHALSPGHGKTIVAAYLVGTRGTPAQALLLGLTVTATHTAAVYLLGGVTLLATAYVLPERIYPWLSAASGMLVLLLGARLAASRVAHLREHLAHGRGQQHTHRHQHDAPGPTEKGWRGLIVLGISGGMLPCPSALVLMLSAIAVQQIAMGLALTAAFSAGLAAVLTGLGLVVVAAARASRRLPGRPGGLPAGLVAGAPVLGAVVVTLAGAALTVDGLRQVLS